MLKLIDPDHPFYRPLWIRLLIVAFCGVWTAVEFYGEQTVWGMIFLAMTAYASAALLVFYKPNDNVQDKAEGDEKNKSDEGDAAN
ncbi:hypothetical protein [Ensifer sp. MJa1]|uniref:hypothetical protein n=1 Tax=Ensifer sp. MJa1 TaxID=2919888 RepID=UPI00300AD521